MLIFRLSKVIKCCQAAILQYAFLTVDVPLIVTLFLEFYILQVVIKIH